MKKILILFVSVVALLMISVTVYWNLPIEITRKSDIEKGNKIIQNIKSYEKKFDRLPENSDYKTLENLVYNMKIHGFILIIRPITKVILNLLILTVLTDLIFYGILKKENGRLIIRRSSSKKTAFSSSLFQ
ncbi:hypothetical protein [Chryseobacterium gambrini]|uniref:hypothetical protein n=1 Tax=Chryseobacterium gambrini TaxID=373672 RepID=UPI0022F395ED|nr:hypothetical protein [Chryseobacterium gambrini]WBX98330.1 hypothetical protein PE065_03505 [Chryseobacterium gambrini]